MPAENDDWRIQGQEKQLYGRRWTWRRYQPYREGWGHDHCAFCGLKLADDGTPDSLHEGYSTLDDYHWVCGTCFEDFREQFGWTETAGA
jgi:hypothetical protein